jgi:hypothetical protein
MKTKTIAAETSDPLAGKSFEEVLAIGKWMKEVERLAVRDADREKRGLARGDLVGTHEVLVEGLDLNRIYSSGDTDEKIALPRRSKIGDLVEIPEGGWIPRNAVRKLSDEEIAAAAEEGRLALQAIARLRAKEKPMTAAETSLRAIEVDLEVNEAARRSANERKAVLESERETRKARLAVAAKDFESEFEGRSPQWRNRVLEALAEDWSRPPKLEAPQPARAVFGPRAPGGPKSYVWNSVTGQHEEI